MEMAVFKVEVLCGSPVIIFSIKLICSDMNSRPIKLFFNESALAISTV